MEPEHLSKLKGYLRILLDKQSSLGFQLLVLLRCSLRRLLDLLLFDGWNKFQTSSYIHVIKLIPTYVTPSPMKKIREKDGPTMKLYFSDKNPPPKFLVITDIFGVHYLQFFVVKTHSHPLTINPSPTQSPRIFIVPYHDIARWRYNSPLWVATRWYPSALKVAECQQRHWWRRRKWCWSPVAKVVAAGTQHGIFPQNKLSVQIT